MNIKQDTIIRTVVLFVALLNQFLTMKGMSPLPFEEDEITEMLSYLFTAIAAIWSWWKNNSFTKNAIEADEVLAQLKKGSE
jgi:SPP1 family holin